MTQKLIIDYYQKNSLRLLAVACRHTGYDRNAAFSEAACVPDLFSGELEFGSEMIALLQQVSFN